MRVLEDTAFMYPVQETNRRVESYVVFFRGDERQHFSDDAAGRHIVDLIRQGMRQVVYMRWERPWTAITAREDYKRRTDPIIPPWLATVAPQQ